MKQLFPVAVVVIGLASLVSAGDDSPLSELATLAAKVETFRVVPLPSEPGQVTCRNEDSLTIDLLRDIDLDDRPPVLREPAHAYPAEQSDGCPSGTAPYIARGIRPFRFQHFTNEFSYGGWHNFEMQDYASAHGFQIIYPYVRDLTKDAGHFPDGTRWLYWGDHNWDAFKAKRGIPTDRLDQLMDADAVNALVAEGAWKNKPPFDTLMIDIEYYPLSPEDLRKQSWYPNNVSDAEKAVFEKKYYAGYALSYTAPADAARRQGGWSTIGFYGWQPFNFTWFELADAQVDPATYWPWNTYGRPIYDSCDIVYPNLYVFYPSPQNVAYTLANYDLSMKILRAAPAQKPMRPYYWTLMHGGDIEYRWWTSQPLRDEEVRAMTAMTFFSACDGCVLWNWSEFANHHIAPPLVSKKDNAEIGRDVMFRDAFEVKAEGDAPATRTFHRYDMVHILSVDAVSGLVRFEPIEMPRPENGFAYRKHQSPPGTPVYQASRAELERHLRALSEPIAAMIEGLALVKPLERMLKTGEAVVDVSAQKQFAESLPIVRRVRLGKVHLLITYDPTVTFGAPPRTVELNDFNGRQGLTVQLPADDQTRIFVLREP